MSSCLVCVCVYQLGLTCVCLCTVVGPTLCLCVCVCVRVCGACVVRVCVLSRPACSEYSPVVAPMYLSWPSSRNMKKERDHFCYIYVKFCYCYCLGTSQSGQTSHCHMQALIPNTPAHVLKQGALQPSYQYLTILSNNHKDVFVSISLVFSSGHLCQCFIVLGP